MNSNVLRVSWVTSVLLIANVIILCASREHVTISNEELEDQRVIVIGDVHGCLDELKALLKAADAYDESTDDIKNDTIVILAGDLVNKGPYSLRTLQWARQSKVKAVVGNHETKVLDRGIFRYPWLAGATDDDIKYMEDLPWTVTIPKWGVTVVHAGLMPDTPIAFNEEYTMTYMRNLLERDDGSYIPLEFTSAGENWASIYEGPYHVVYGHDAGRGRDILGNPMIQEWDYATGLDTRCVYGGELTAIVLPPENKVFIKVQCDEYDGWPMDYDYDESED